MSLTMDTKTQERMLLALPDEEQSRIQQHAVEAEEAFQKLLMNICYPERSEIERAVILNALLRAWSAADSALYGKLSYVVVTTQMATLRAPTGKFGEGMSDRRVQMTWSVDRREIKDVVPGEK